MNNQKEAQRLMSSIVEQWGSSTLTIYQKIQKKFNYPLIESNENKEIYRGRFYALAFGCLIENYIQKISDYIYFDGYDYTSSLVKFQLTQNTKTFFEEININHLDYREEFWREEDPYPEYEFGDMYCDANIKIMKIIISDIVSHFKTKEKIMAFLFQVFKGFVDIEDKQYSFYTEYNNKSKGSIITLSEEEFITRENTFYNSYFCLINYST